MTSFLGLDPGPSSGVVLLTAGPGFYRWAVFQCDADSVTFLTRHLVEEYRPRCLAAEKFLASNKAGSSGKAADVTRSTLAQAETVAHHYGVPVILKPAGHVKPWATDTRLARANFPFGPKFRDVRDAGRHVLFSAVMHYGVTDPLY